jgi:hypothetical protein
MSTTSNIPSAAELKDAVFVLLGTVDCETITRKELTRDLESNHGNDERKRHTNNALWEVYV